MLSQFKKSELIEVLNNLDPVQLISTLERQGIDPIKFSKNLDKAMYELVLKANRVTILLMEKANVFGLGMVVEAKEDCLGNFRKGDQSVLTKEKEGGFLLGSLVVLDVETLITFFKPIGFATNEGIKAVLGEIEIPFEDSKDANIPLNRTDYILRALIDQQIAHN